MAASMPANATNGKAIAVATDQLFCRLYAADRAKSAEPAGGDRIIPPLLLRRSGQGGEIR